MRRPMGVGRPFAASTGESPISTVALWLLSLFIFSIPLENSIVIPGIGTIGRVIGLVAFIAGIVAVVESGKFRTPIVPHLMMVLFVVWVSLSYFWTIGPEETTEELISYVQLIAMVLLIWAEAPKAEQQERLMRAYIIGAGVLAVATIMQNEGSAVVGVRQGAFNMNPNDIGLRIVISVPMALYLSVKEKNPLWAWFYRIQVVAAACGMFFTASRGAFVAFLAAMLMIPLTLRQWTGKQKLATAVLVVIGALIAIRMVPQRAFSRLGETSSEITEGTMDARTVIWNAGLEVFYEHPFLGIGAGAFPVAVQAKTATAWAPHNTFLSVLVELGSIGFGIFAVMLITLITAAMRMEKLERSLWLVMLLSWGLGCFVMNWEYYKPTWFLFAMLAVQSAAYATAPVRQRVAQMGRQPYRGQPGRVPKRVREFWNTNFEQQTGGPNVEERSYRPVRGKR
ncbi:MAG TPA: O-antigen ligase family protein [Candidatus Acidoferrum sp.]|nr:O-antigen ligase family protein [Candidatus Acidoferrum sp.]